MGGRCNARDGARLAEDNLEEWVDDARLFLVRVARNELRDFDGRQGHGKQS